MIFWEPKKCDRCGVKYASGMVRVCPKEVMHETEENAVCIYCCRRCRYNRRDVFGDRCEYE